MSTSLLYHAFGIRGQHYVRSEYVGGEVHLHMKQKPEQIRCPACGSFDVIRRGKKERTFKTLPIGTRPVKLLLPVQRVQCNRCSVVRQVRLPFAEPKRTYTKSFARYVLELCRLMTIEDVAQHLGVSWDLVKGIHKRHLRKHYGRPRLKGLRRIAIDEVSTRRGRRYLSIVLDLESGAIVFVGEGRSSDSLEPFWRRLRRSGAQIEAVATDMLPAYVHAVGEHLPGAALVFDRFHVVRLYNETLTRLRRDLQREAEQMQKDVLKGTRWLLLKNPENLDGSRGELQRLRRALELNRPLATAYYLKDDLRQLWEQPDKQTARQYLAGWLERARASGIALVQKFARTLQAHQWGILAWYDHRISTGPLEGTNNKIKTLQRKAYGYRDDEYFRLRLHSLHETKYALVG